MHDAQGVLYSVPVLSQTDLTGGLLGGLSSFVGVLYDNPPLSTSEYIASLGTDLTFAKEAKAQVTGSGAAALNPVISLWKVSRNISYIIMVIIFLIIGFMVMFRQKINPQTVITVQAALPGLVIGLIMITFSYFAASLLTDTAYIGTNLVGYYFSYAKDTNQPILNIAEIIKDQNIITIISSLTGSFNRADVASGISLLFGPSGLQGGSRDLVNVATTFISYKFGSEVGSAFTGPISAGLTAIPGVGSALGPASKVIGDLATGGLGVLWGSTDTSGFFSALVYGAVVLMLLYTMYKLLMRLINNYISLLFLTITAPFQFLFASLPGRQGIGTNWIQNVLANALAFPAVLAAFHFAAFILGTDGSSVFGLNKPINLTSELTLPLLGGFSNQFLRFLIGFAAIMSTPAIPDIVAQAVGKIGKAGAMIGQEVSGGYKSSMGYFGQVRGAAGDLGKNATQLQGFATTSTATRGVGNPLTGAPGPITGYQVNPGWGSKIKTGWKQLLG